MKNTNIKKYNILFTILYVLLGFFAGFSQTNKFVVTLDAGHGNQDFGAVYNGHVEKKIALSLVLKVGKILEQQKDMDVIYTRKTDVFIGLVERANIANKANSAIFVSIHCNANKNTEAYGTETYVMGMSKNASNLEAAKKENSVVVLEKDYKSKYEGFDPSKPESMISMTLMQEEYLENSINLAGKVQDKFVNQLGKKSRGGGVKQAPYMVLHKAYMPRILVETGFISNPTEGNYLDSEIGQDEIASAIANAIIEFKKENFDGDFSITQEPSKVIKKTEKEEKANIFVTQKDIPNKIEIKTPTKTKEVITDKPVTNSVVFKVQLAASSKKIETTPSNFSGLSSISFTYDSTIYRYSYGEASNYDEAQTLLEQAKNKGYTTAFIIAFKDGKSISVKEALKL
ncbi:MAG: N-acetylmuramoyl-L-alanine amidase [Flavobacterium sp.]